MKNHQGGNATEFQDTYTKRSPLGHYFLLPNEIFTLGLNPGELSVYAYLIYCENRETYQCWPSIGRISQYTGMSANTVAKYIRQLEEKQLINVEPTKVRTKSGEVRNGTLRFTIRPIQEAVDYKLERDLAALPVPKEIRKRKRESNSALCGPVCDFGGRVGDLHQQGTKSALLSQRDPVLNEQSRPDQPKKGDTPPLPLKGEG